MDGDALAAAVTKQGSLVRQMKKVNDISQMDVLRAYTAVYDKCVRAVSLCVYICIYYIYTQMLS